MTRSADGELHIDSVLRNTYKVVSVLGRGGMGSVFLAQHLRLPGKHVAVKVLRVGDHVGPEIHVRFRREAEIASRLGHPNIVEVLDFDTLEDGSPFLVLEYLRGESLQDRLRRGRLSLEEVFSFTRQMGSALQTAHRAGIVHRDLKPANIFLVPTDSGGVLGERVKLLDFGISKVISSETLQTQEAVLIGTPQYMSPEQAQGRNRQVDARTDLFALGGIVFEMLSGMTPFGGGSLAQIIYRVVHEPPVSLATLMPELPAHIPAAVARALEKNPDNRFQDVGAFVTALTGATLQSLPETEEMRASRSFSRPSSSAGVALPSAAQDDAGAMGATMAPVNKGPSTNRFGPGDLAAADAIGFDATMASSGTAQYGEQPRASVPEDTMGFGATQLPIPGVVRPSGVALPVVAAGAVASQHGAPVQGGVAGQSFASGGFPGQYVAPGSMGGQQAVPGSMGGQQAVPGPHAAAGSFSGQQAAPGSLGGHLVGPQGQPLAPVNVTGPAGQPGPTPLPVEASASGKPKSRLVPIVGTAALILGAVGLGWWLRPHPPVAPPPVVSAPTPPPVARTDTPPPVVPTPPVEPPKTPVVESPPPVTPPTVKPPVKQAGVRAPPRLRNPTQSSAIDALREARAALAARDPDRAVRMAQRSYTEQDNLAAHLLAIRVRCQTRDLANALAESRKVTARERQEVASECQTYDIELPP